MVPETIIVIERKFCLLFGYHNAFFSERFAVNGKLFTTDAYCQGFKKDNSITWTNSSSNKVNVIKKNFLSSKLQLSCIWGQFMSTSDSNVTELNVILFCNQFSLLPFPLCYDEYSGRHLTAFMEVVNRNNISTEVIFASEILHKCIIISRDEDESDICIPCNIRIEKD
jgi:hypothetical protein